MGMRSRPKKVVLRAIVPGPFPFFKGYREIIGIVSHWFHLKAVLRAVLPSPFPFSSRNPSQAISTHVVRLMSSIQEGALGVRILTVVQSSR